MSNLEEIVDGVEPDQEPTEPEVVEVEEASDDKTPKVEPPKVEPEPKPEAQVPLAALLEVRQQLQEVKSLVTPKQPSQPAPDVLEDPAGYQAHMRSLVAQSSVTQKLELSRFIAEREFGAEKVQVMFDYFNENPEQSAQFLSSPSPFHAGMDYFNRQQVATEIGNDPKAYTAKLRAEITAEVKAEVAAEQVSREAGQPAPSMAKITGTGGGVDTTWTGPAPLGSILGE